MKIGISKIDLLDELEKAICINEFSVFIGAGLSKGAGYFDWKDLLKAPAMKLDLDVDEEHDLVSLAQYYCNQEGRPEINKLIRDTFPTSLPLNENYRLLSYLPIDTYWTTNYDILIEKSLRENSREPLVITEDKNMHLQSKKYDAVVYKMHGDVENPNNAVLTRDDYERYGITERVLFKDVLEGHLITNTFLFLGFSFTDPNFNFILGKLNALTDRNTRKHYCVIKKVLAEDFTKEVDGKRVLDEEKYKYNQIKQKLFIKDLKSRYKIETYLIESYDEITEVLSDLYCRYKKKTVFISGSADVYDPLDEQDAQRLISRLSYRMAEEGYHIVSGYGKGIGSYIIDGVTEYCYSKHNKKISDYLTLMPFPLNSVSNKDLKDTWSQYRDEMIQSAGIALFMFGNKLKDGELATADGMIEEFEISKKYKLDIIPLEYTGNASKQISELNGGYIENINETSTEVLVTSFTTHGTPLIRYRIGDSIEFSDENACDCGNESIIIKNIEGRALDFLYAHNGSKINAGNIANVFKYISNAIIKAQIVQDKIGEVTVNIVIDEKTYKANFDDLIKSELNEKLGLGTNIIINHVQEIERENSGKFKFIKNKVGIYE